MSEAENTAVKNMIHSIANVGHVHNDIRVRVDKLEYTWIIDNQRFQHAGTFNLITPSFTSDTNDQYKWSLSLTYNESTKSIGLHLGLQPFSEFKVVFFRCKFSILDSELKESYAKKSKGIVKFGKFKLGAYRWGFPNFIEKDVLFARQDVFFINDKLVIYCEAMFSEDEDSINETYQRESVLPRLNEYSISTDLGLLYKNQMFTDFTISVNGKNFKVHKIILAARSSVFAGMFRHNSKENEENCVEITDIDAEIVQEMLNYIYTGLCENLENLAQRLLVAADKYDLKGLIIMCQEMLLKNLSSENAADLLNFAHLHYTREFKSEILNFIVNNSTEVMNSAVWKNVAPSFPASLFMELCVALSHQVDTYLCKMQTN